ncbi:MAG: urea amidolyase associated protein UAAP1 [Acetobacter orientalis]|uniref:urea amidolyase associated protein UAAP1 n=1 Tax=Acetobacter orientalis TaxID=146474 RepID=UPI0039ED75E3
MKNDMLTLRPCLYEEHVPGGGHTSLILKRGRVLRIKDIEGGTNISATFLNADQKSERFNLPDTLKGQHTAKLTAGHCLYSDMGRVLLAITEDSCGWHDSFGGVLNAQEVEEKYGKGPYQELRNKFYRNGHDNLLVEMGKWNLNLQDLLMVVNFFSKVTVDEEGRFSFVSGHSSAGDFIDLYAPMDVLIILTALQHPMDPDPHYNPKPISFSVHEVVEDGISFGCHTSRPENGRAFFNTALYCV